MDLVVEYYRLQELPVPAKDLADCNELLENEKKAGGLPEYWRNLPEITPPKPAYGTPEFWKQHWAKKKAAAAAAEGSGAPEEKVKKVCAKKLWKIMELFNENHKYLSYSIFILRKRASPEEPSLFCP